MASRAFLAMLSVQLETLAVDYSNASKTFDGPGMRDRGGERKTFLSATADTPTLPVGELHYASIARGRSSLCPPQHYLFVDSSLLQTRDPATLSAIEHALSCGPTRRGLIVAMREPPSATGFRGALNCELLPRLRAFNFSFDPISTGRLAQARFCCKYSPEHRRNICCLKCCVGDGAASGAPLLFFVADGPLLRIGQPGSTRLGQSSARLHSAADAGLGNSMEAGIMMSADYKYLPVARTVMRVLRNQSALPTVVVKPDLPPTANNLRSMSNLWWQIGEAMNESSACQVL